MRILLATVSLVAMAGVAFAGEPQKTTTAGQPVVASVHKQAPVKMTDRQLEKIVAGSSGNTYQLNATSSGKYFYSNCSSYRGLNSGGGNSAYVIYCY